MNVCTKCKTTYEGAFCPNCGTPANQTPPQKQGNSALGISAFIFSILGFTFGVAIILSIIDLRKKDGRKKSLSIAALIICGIWVLGGIGNMVKKDTTNATTISSVEESPIPAETPSPTQEPMVELPEPSTEATESEPNTEADFELEEREEQKETTPYKEAFEKGFNDHFSISDENKENLDSIKDSADEIWNDDEVQEAYDNYKESLKNLFGK